MRNIVSILMLAVAVICPGQPKAQTIVEIADSLYYNATTASDVKPAIQYYERAATTGDIVAKYRLGTIALYCPEILDGQACERYTQFMTELSNDSLPQAVYCMTMRALQSAPASSALATVQPLLAPQYLRVMPKAAFAKILGDIVYVLSNNPEAYSGTTLLKDCKEQWQLIKDEPTETITLWLGLNGDLLSEKAKTELGIQPRSLSVVGTVNPGFNPDEISEGGALQMPSFPGGEMAMYEYLCNNVTYPQGAFKDRIEGSVVVGFVVTKTGEIKDVQVVKGCHPDLDAEAVRVIQSMPRWIPGTNDGTPANVRLSLPVTFKQTN